MANQFTEDNPILRHPGRPTVLDEKIKRKICSETLTMYGNGVQLTTAQERVAERLGISVRTVRGVWRHRHLLPKDPQSLTDLFQIISALR